MRKFVSYVRVSTAKQGSSGLGLEAQRAAVANYVATRGELTAEFVEIETGKGSNALDRRPRLKEALDVCKRSGSMLLIAKLDRLARNVHFVSGLLEAGIDFVAADMPDANKTMIQIHSVMAEWERDQISARTKAALAAAKARGVRLGTAGSANLRPNLFARKEAATAFAQKLRALVDVWTGQGLSQRAIVDQLNLLGISAPKGGTWSLVQVQRLLRRLASEQTIRPAQAMSGRTA